MLPRIISILGRTDLGKPYLTALATGQNTYVCGRLASSAAEKLHHYLTFDGAITSDGARRYADENVRSASPTKWLVPEVVQNVHFGEAVTDALGDAKARQTEWKRANKSLDRKKENEREALLQEQQRIETLVATLEQLNLVITETTELRTEKGLKPSAVRTERELVR